MESCRCKNPPFNGRFGEKGFASAINRLGMALQLILEFFNDRRLGGREFSSPKKAGKKFDGKSPLHSNFLKLFRMIKKNQTEKTNQWR